MAPGDLRDLHSRLYLYMDNRMNTDEQNEQELEAAECLAKARAAQLNLNLPRTTLEAFYGKVWTTEDLKGEWIIVEYDPPLVFVKSRADDSSGTFEFQNAPRFYFNLVKD